jgi:hypothetical protein
MLLLTDAVKDINENDHAFLNFCGTEWQQTPILRAFVPKIGGNI